MKRQLVITLPSLVLTMSAVTAASPPSNDGKMDIDRLFEMSIDELVNLKVGVVSNRDETILEAPAIVSRLDRKKMEKLGLRSLKEILSFLPGVVVNTEATTRKPIMIRGLYDNDDQKILFILDNTPYWMPSRGTIPLLGIPASVIERVEVIRGPGGVIYGTNASAGVIRVVTRKDKKSELGLALGDHDLVIANSYGSYEIGGGLLTAALEGRNDNGYQAEAKRFFDVSAFSFSDEGQIHRAQEHVSGLIKYEVGGFQLMGHAYQETETTSINANLANSTVAEKQSFLVTSSYDYELDHWNFKLYGDYSQYDARQDIDDLVTFNSAVRGINPPIVGDGNFEFENEGRDNYRWKLGMRATAELADRFWVDLGVENELRSTETELITDDANGADLTALTGSPVNRFYSGGQVREMAAYAQLDYKLDLWRFVLGARHTDNEEYGDQLTPKASIVYQFDQNQSLKLLYSEGFNSPTLAQVREPNFFTVSTDPYLSPETIRSSDIAYTYSDSNHNFVFNAFYVEVKDLIERVVVFGVSGFRNSDIEIRRHGAEIEYHYSYQHWNLFANAHYLHQGNKESVSDPSAFAVPKVTAALGLSYTLGKQTIGVSNRFAGEQREKGSYNLLNLSYNWRNGPLEFYADFLNLRDEKISRQSTEFLNFPFEMESDQGMTAVLGLVYHSEW